MVALSDSHMEIKVTDPDRGKKQSPSKVATAAATADSGNTNGNKKKKCGPSSPPTTKREPKSPTAGLRQGGEREGKTGVTPNSKKVEDAQKVDHTEPTLDVKSNVEGEAERVSGFAQDRVGSISKEEETAELLEKSQSGQGDGLVRKKGERKTASKKKGLDLDSVRVEAAADPNLLVKEDGSVFVNVNRNYTKTRPLDRVTQTQEPKESKFQFSNQLAFSLD